MSRTYQLASLVALEAALVGCGTGYAARIAAPAADLLISVRAGAVAAPDSVAAGWARVRVEEDGAGHILVIFRLPGAATEAEVASFLAALDTAAATPKPAVALGGPEIGEVGEVIVELVPGRYVLGCVRRGPEGHRHASTGEARLLVVTGGRPAPGRAAPPPATEEIRMVEFAYVGPERWAAGSRMLRLENRGRQDHQLRLVRLKPGASMQQWLVASNPNQLGTAVTGVARISPGGVAYLPADLPAGSYVAHCLITDPASGKRHIELGMLRAIRVE